MTPTLLFTSAAVLAAVSTATAIAARAQLREDALRTEKNPAELVGRDPRALPDRLFKARGVRMKRWSIASGVLAFVMLIAYATMRG